MGKHFIQLQNCEGNSFRICSIAAEIYFSAQRDLVQEPFDVSGRLLNSHKVPLMLNQPPKESNIKIMMSNILRPWAHPDVRQNNTNLLLSSIYKLTEDEDTIKRTKNNMLSMIVQTLSINNGIDLIKMNSGLPFQRKSI